MHRSLFIPLLNRSSWEDLTEQTVLLLRQLLADDPRGQVTIVGESVRVTPHSGGCPAICMSYPLP